MVGLTSVTAAISNPANSPVLAKSAHAVDKSTELQPDTPGSNPYLMTEELGDHGQILWHPQALVFSLFLLFIVKKQS